MMALRDAVWSGCSGWPGASGSPLTFRVVRGVPLRYRTPTRYRPYKQVIPNPLSLKFLHFPSRDIVQGLSHPAQNQPTQGLAPDWVKGWS